MSICVVSNERNSCLERSFSTHLSDIENIKKKIQENNYSRAAHHILLLCDSQSLDFQVIEEVYSLLKDLLPLLSEEDFFSLQSAIPKLLNLSPNFIDLQRDLAIQLAGIYVNKGDTTCKSDFRLYIQAMHYYANVLKMAKKHDIEDIHYLASRIFMKVIQVHNINSERIKNQLELAIKEGSPEKFERSLKHIEVLKKYRVELKDDDKIIHLYKQAEDVFNKIQEASRGLFRPFLDVIQNGLFNELPTRRGFITKSYLKAFHQFRNSFKKELKEVSLTLSKHPVVSVLSTTIEIILSNKEEEMCKLDESSNFTHTSEHFPMDADIKVRDFQKRVINNFKTFFYDHLLSDAFAILGDPPCDCDLRAMGSIGRKEICPYSDLEWMILISDDIHIPFFKTLASFIELKIVSLGETVDTDFTVFTALGTKNSSGFHIDNDGNPAQGDLIGSPEKIANLQKPINQDQDYDPRSPGHIMLKTISLYQTTPCLFDQYQNCMDEILDKELPEEEKISSLTVRERRALKLIEKRLFDYKKAWNVHFEEHQVINIKEQYIEVLQHLISDLALLYGIKETNTLDIIDSLQLKQIFTEESSILLKEAVSFIYMLRVRLHLGSKEQKEEAYINTKQNEVCIGLQKARIETSGRVFRTSGGVYRAARCMHRISRSLY